MEDTIMFINEKKQANINNSPVILNPYQIMLKKSVEKFIRLSRENGMD